MKKTMTTLAALTTCVAFSSMTHAASLIIDDFVTPPTGQTVSVTGVASGSNTTTDLIGVLGGSRTMAVDVSTSIYGNTSTLTVGPSGPGTLSFSNDSGQNAMGTVLWDANGEGLGGVDLTNGGTLPYLQTKILSSDLDVGFRVDITDTSGFTAFYTVNLGPGVSYVYELLSNFNNAGNVDFTLVNSILLTLTGPNAQDSTLDLLEITNTPVPEPASLALIGLGGAMMFIRRRRQA